MAIPPEVEARLGPAKDLEGLSDADLKAVLKEYYDRCAFSTTKITSQKYNNLLWKLKKFTVRYINILKIHENKSLNF